MGKGRFYELDAGGAAEFGAEQQVLYACLPRTIQATIERFPQGGCSSVLCRCGRMACCMGEAQRLACGTERVPWGLA